jgi:hypothetical protein
MNYVYENGKIIGYMDGERFVRYVTPIPAGADE